MFSDFIHDLFYIKSRSEPRVLLKQRDWDILLRKPVWTNSECTMTHSHFLNLISPKEHRSVSHYANNTIQWLQVTKQLVSLDAFLLRCTVKPQTKRKTQNIFISCSLHCLETHMTSSRWFFFWVSNSKDRAHVYKGKLKKINL